MAINSTIYGDIMPYADGLKLATHLNLIDASNQEISLTEEGSNLTTAFPDENLDIAPCRQILLELVFLIMPAWTNFIQLRLEERISTIPDNWIEILEYADLLDDDLDEEGLIWWKTIRENLRKNEAERNKKTGDAGEILSMRHEGSRLTLDGRKELADLVKRVSLDSDDYGYDISSFQGSLVSSTRLPEDELHVEVKSSQLNASDTFRFYLSRYEWNEADENMDQYYFHLWKNVKIKSSEISGDGPIIITAAEIEHYIPSDTLPNGEWWKVRITLRVDKINEISLNGDEDVWS